MKKQLEVLTQQLLSIVEETKKQFEKSKETGKEGDFFLEVKPFAELVKKTSEEWILIAAKWVETEKPLFINKKQLESTFEHLENIAIQSFYPTTSRKRFLSSVQTVEYVLKSILQKSVK